MRKKKSLLKSRFQRVSLARAPIHHHGLRKHDIFVIACHVRLEVDDAATAASGSTAFLRMGEATRSWGRIVLATILLLLSPVIAFADQEGVRYATPFLTRTPTAAELAQVNVPAADLVVAKVRVRATDWRGNRHEAPSTPTSSFAAATIAQVLEGSRTYQGDILLSFRSIPPKAILMSPVTPAQKAREYFVAFYRDSHGENRLIEFPAEKAEYESWATEVAQYLAEQSRPGPRKR